MKSLIFVKHSLPEVIENIPAREWKLSEEGRVRAERLAEKLKAYQPQVIVSSVEPKAEETAKIIAHNIGLEYQTLIGLHEHDRSTLPYYSRADFEALLQRFFAKPNTPVFGNETANQALIRFRDAVEPILNSYDDQTVVIVAHGTVISLFVAWLTDCDGYLLWNELGLPSFVVLDIQSKALLKIENLS